MVKSVLGVNHQGLRDWLIQRVSAIILALYTIGMLLFFVQNPDPDYQKWYSLFQHTGMKVITLVTLLALLYHAWIGMWTILTDYIKPFLLRFILYVSMLLALIGFFFAGFLILWSVV